MATFLGSKIIQPGICTILRNLTFTWHVGTHVNGLQTYGPVPADHSRVVSASFSCREPRRQAFVWPRAFSQQRVYAMSAPNKALNPDDIKDVVPAIDGGVDMKIKYPDFTVEPGIHVQPSQVQLIP